MKAMAPFSNILSCRADQYSSIDTWNIKICLLLIILWQNIMGQQHIALNSLLTTLPTRNIYCKAHDGHIWYFNILQFIVLYCIIHIWFTLSRTHPYQQGSSRNYLLDSNSCVRFTVMYWLLIIYKRQPTLQASSKFGLWYTSISISISISTCMDMDIWIWIWIWIWMWIWIWI